jgi:hypothetical protein
MPNLDSFTNIEAYSNQVEIPGIASIIHEDSLNQATHGNHCELSNTKILAVYNDVTNNKGMVRIGDRVSDFAIEWGTPVEFYNGAVKQIIPLRLSDTKFLLTYVLGADDDGYCIAATVSGTTPTFGSVVEFADATTCYPIGAVLMDTDKVMIAYQDATVNQKAIIASISGTTITLGTAATINSTIDTQVYTTDSQLCKHTSTLATVVYRVSATVTEAVTLSLSGTTITVNTAGKAAFGGSANIGFPAIAALDSTKFVIAYTDITDTNKGNSQVGTISGTTITAGASEYNFDSLNNSARVPSIVALSDKYFALMYSSSSGGTYSNECRIAFVSGTVISYYAASTIASGSVSGSTGYYPGMESGGIVRLTYTKARQLTFSYRSAVLNQFICGMLRQDGTTVNFVSMCYKVASASSTQQIEISSVYFKSNIGLFVLSSDYTVEGRSASLYLNGTFSSNKFYSTSNDKTNYYSATLFETARLGMSNEPIILAANQALYASIGMNQGTSSRKGSCTVFGIKRS